MSEYTTIAAVTVRGSNVAVELIRSNVTCDHFYTVTIDGKFWDGDYCTVAEGIDRLVNPFGVSPIVSQNDVYDSIDGDFFSCYHRVA